MKTILGSGILLGLLVTAWMFVMGFTGWYKQPAFAGLFFLVILIQIVVLVVALRHTARQGRRYGGQVVAGTLISVIGGILIVIGSIVFTTVAFPHYFEDIRAMQEQLMRQGGTPDDEIQRRLDAYSAAQTPVTQAITGFIGTLITGVVASMIIGAFVRAKPGEIRTE